MLKRILFVVLLLILALVLLALPSLVRWLYFYDGEYEPQEVNRPDLNAIKAHAPEMEPFDDDFAITGPGTIIVDQAHSNRFDMSDLNVLQARLSTRAQRLEVLETVDDLDTKLRHAQALIIISPGEDWLPDEIQQVQEFVDKGGRLLLITDPTRYGVAYDEWDYPILDDDVPHINDLAAQFGLIFQADYLHNTTENEANFRNIKLTEFASHDLVEGLDQVVFYASHSIISDEPALISTSGETRSSSSERPQDLAVAVLAGDGAVLALGDLTFMSEPYHVEYDNEQFVANIASFLGGAERQYDLGDFPLFFGDQTDLVYTGEPLLDSDLLQGGGDLQELFDQADRELTLRSEEDKAHDTLFVGLYEGAEEVEPYLASAGVTLLITPTETIEEQEAEPTSTPVPSLTPSPTPTEPLTITAEVTPTAEAAAEPEVTAESEITITAEISPTYPNKIKIESLGQMVLTGTSMLLHQTEEERQLLVVLAHTENGLQNAIERLTMGDLSSCLLQAMETPTVTVLALCPTGEVASGEGGGGWQKPETGPPPPTLTLSPAATSTITDTAEPITDTEETPEPTPEPAGEPEGKILVMAMDQGEGRYDSLTSADDYASILKGRFDVTMHSLDQDGPPNDLDVFDYDLVIWSFGDFDGETMMEDPDVADILLSVMFGEVPFLMSGAFIGDTDVETVQRDIEVKDATHPVTNGFSEGEVIAFVPSPSGSEYEVSVLETYGEEGNTISFVRGPDSEDSGAPTIVTAEDEFNDSRIGFIGFPLHLLPDEAKTRLVLNMVDWLLNL